MSYKTKTISYHNRVRFFWVLTAVSLLSLFIYIYAINTIARNVAERQELEKQIAQTGANLSSLEFAYIKLKNSVTIETAHEYGFKEVSSPLYVSRARLGALTFNTVSR
ncbi:MAG: hypothetical protein WD896_02655 [Parcubacteria group bacterium]